MADGGGTWVVWGSFPDGSAMTVEEGLTEPEAEESAERRNATAQKYNFVGGYFALPEGRDPSEVLS